MRGARTRKGKQQRLSEALVKCGALAPLRWLHDRGRRPVLILAYHRIAEWNSEATYPLDIGLVSASATQFGEQMRLLREYANPVSLDQIADAFQHGRELPERAVAVTFDDGFVDTFDTAFPLLSKYQIPATVFVSTGHVDSQEPFWFEFVAHLLLRIPPRALEVEGSSTRFPNGDGLAARRQSIATLQTLLTSFEERRRREHVETWRRAFASKLDARALESARSISRPQIEIMARAGIDFGSHTISHPNLARASDADIGRELRGSRNELEAILGRPVRFLAYPFGVPGTYDARAMLAARECGYSLAVSYRQGVNWMETLRPFELRRIGLGRDMSAELFRAMTTLPDWIHPHFDAHA